MLLDYIKFPKIVTKQEWELNPNEYLEYKVVDKNKYNILLLPTDIISNTTYWRIDEIANRIYIENKESIFVLVSREGEKIEMVFGVAFKPFLLDLSFVKISFNIREISKKKKEIVERIKLIKEMYQEDLKLVVYSSFVKDEEIIKQMFETLDYEHKSLEKLLNKIKFHQPLYKRAIPFVAIGVLYLILNNFAINYTDKFLTNVKKHNFQKKRELLKTLQKEEKINKKLKQENERYSNIKEKAFLLKNKIYHEGL